jgi:uncharacterized protein (TIGR03118 family)
LDDRCLLDGGMGYVQSNLVSDIPGFAPNTDRSLINPWGFSEDSAGQFRVAANGSGRGILFDAQGQKSGADIIIPAPAGSPAGTTSTPNGVVSNPTSGFDITVKGRTAPASLLFSTEDGTIAGWNPALSQTSAVIAADQSGNGAVYKLLAVGTNANGAFIFATNFHNGTVDIFDSNFNKVSPGTDGFASNAFVDPTTGLAAIPSDFAPFGIKNFNGTLFVTYAKQDAAKHDDVAGVGNGFIDEFDTGGNFIRRFATQGLLNSPIGATIAPADFGPFSNDVLIGNFGDSHVNAFTPSGQFLGQLTDTQGNPLVLNGGFTETDTKGLWGIGFGNGAGGAATDTLFFAAGINQENDGLFGKVNFDPSPNAVSSPQIAGQLLATAAISANDIWAVGFSDQVTAPPVVDTTLAEHFDGKSWSIVPTPSSFHGQLQGVAGAASDDVWAVGVNLSSSSSGGPLVEHWDGTSWSVVSNPVFTGVGVAAISAHARNDVWIVGNNGGNAGVEHWDGTSWSTVSSPAFTGVSLNAVSADASNDVWAVGDASTIFGAPFSGPAVLHFDGTSWNLIIPNTPPDFTAVTALSPTNVWAVGTVQVLFDHKAHHQAAIEHWDGTSWSVVPSPSPTKSPGLDSTLDGIAAISANDIWAVGSVITSTGQMATLTEHWDGASWKIVGSPNPGNFSDGLSGVTALSDGTVVAVGFQQDKGFDKDTLILQK